MYGKLSAISSSTHHSRSISARYNGRLQTEALMKRWLLVVLLCVAASQTRPTTLPAAFTGVLPQPPQQNAAWQRPESKLPPKLVAAVELLFKQGMADPRGCEYRRIEVVVGNVWNGGGQGLVTHGWVLPAQKGAGEQFAVCWNGLVYPLMSAAEKADLEKDIAELIAADR